MLPYSLCFKKGKEVSGKAVGVPKLSGDWYILNDNYLYLADTEIPRLFVHGTPWDDFTSGSYYTLVRALEKL